MNRSEIARIAHEVNRAYCLALGDASQPAWEDAPDWQKSSALAGVDLHLNNPAAGPQASHESWMAQKVAEGWVYGPEKRPDLKQHHCIYCGGPIPVGEQHVQQEGFYDGAPYRNRYHAECYDDCGSECSDGGDWEFMPYNGEYPPRIKAIVDERRASNNSQVTP